MFGLFSFGSFRGIGMIVLQILRILTVIGLTTAAVACWAMVLHVPQHGAYFVFEAASLIFISLLCAFLVISEFPMIKWVRNKYRTSWPLFSDHHGPTWLGIAVILIGCNLLGKLNQPSFDSKKLGTSVWQLSLAGGILNITFGVLNFFCGMIWSDRKNGINARHIRSRGSLAKAPCKSPLPSYASSHESSPASSIRNEKTKSRFVSMFWHGSNKNAQPAPAYGKRFSRSNISGPFPAHQDVEHDAGAPRQQHPPHYGQPDVGDDDHLTDRQSPILPGVTRPESALHPMYSRSSKYSVATGITRF